MVSESIKTVPLVISSDTLTLLQGFPADFQEDVRRLMKEGRIIIKDRDTNVSS